MGKWIPVATLVLLAGGVWHNEGFPAARPYVAALLVCLCILNALIELRSND